MDLPSGLFSIRTHIVIAAHLLANETSTIVAHEQAFDHLLQSSSVRFACQRIEDLDQPALAPIRRP